MNLCYQNTINKHGREYVHSKSEFTQALVQNHKIDGLTQKEVLKSITDTITAEEVERFYTEDDKAVVALSAVKKYWNKQLTE